MSDIAIKVEGLGKEYIIGHKKEGDLRNAFGQKLKQLFQGGQHTKESFWALKDLNFEIRKGEAVGIIGRNGAGKSTLLKILSRITEPTKGRFEISGRVSSLLEVGTGFHPELSGRENIYLNGTILGMKRAEIKQKFEEIVAFSGVEKFIDTPVKHYSSGMKVRLAFSVAAHLEPEILIVDEVLAVGDAEFQKKCLGKMDEVSKNEGRTVIFVSHNMGAVQNLCERGILLQDGKLLVMDNINSIVNEYIGCKNNTKLLSERTFSAIQAVQFTNLNILTEGRPVSFNEDHALIPAGKNTQFHLSIQCNRENIEKLFIAITILDQNNIKVATLDNLFINAPFEINETNVQVVCEIEKLNLNPGNYFVDLWCSDGYETLQKIEQAYYFEIIDSNYLNTGKSHTVTKHGYFYIDQMWRKL